MSLVPITIYGSSFTGSEVLFLAALADHSYTNGQLIIGNSATSGISFNTLTAGANITITNGNGTITIASTGTGGGLGYLAKLTGTINNSNTIFTFASTPTIVFVNGAGYINGAGVTISGTTATLDNPVGTGGSLFALG